jgi:hypothetical protein
MMNQTYYMELPDSMTPAEVQAEFTALLNDPALNQSRETAVVALSELSDRQWHAYELLDEKIRSQVASCLEEIWLDDDSERAEALFGIAGRLGIPRFLTFIKGRNQSKFESNVRRIVSECIAELEATIEDPYSGMK